MTKEVAIKIYETSFFTSHDDAKAFLKKITEAGILFFSVREKEDKKDPEPKPKLKVIDFKPMLKKSVKKKAPVKKKVQGGKQKYPDEMEDFIIKNCVTMANQKLADGINREFNVNITLSKLAAYMQFKRIKRAELMEAADEEDDEEEDLPTLPPEREY